jgi:hypothetical protein
MPRGEPRQTVPGSPADKGRQAIERALADRGRSGYGATSGAPGQGGKGDSKDNRARGLVVAPFPEDEDDWKPRSWGALGGSVIDHLPERPERFGFGWQMLDADHCFHPATGWAWRTSNHWWHSGCPEWIDWDAEFERHKGR